MGALPEAAGPQWPCGRTGRASGSEGRGGGIIRGPRQIRRAGERRHPGGTRVAPKVPVLVLLGRGKTKVGWWVKDEGVCEGEG